MLIARSMLIVGLAWAGLAPPADAADARILDPERPRSSRVAQLGFDLPPGWNILRGAMEGTPSRGGYQRDREVGPHATCTLTFYGDSKLVGRGGRFRVRNGVLTQGAARIFRVSASGKGVSGRRWYRSRHGTLRRIPAGGAHWESPFVFGAIGLTTPSWFRVPHRPLVNARFQIHSDLLATTSGDGVGRARRATPREIRRCTSFAERTLDPAIESALRTAHIERYTEEPDVH